MIKIGAQLLTNKCYFITMSFPVCPFRCGYFMRLTLPPSVEIGTLHVYLHHLLLLRQQRWFILAQMELDSENHPLCFHR